MWKRRQKYFFSGKENSTIDRNMEVAVYNFNQSLTGGPAGSLPGGCLKGSLWSWKGDFFKKINLLKNV